jgi:hypothetical protein
VSAAERRFSVWPASVVTVAVAVGLFVYGRTSGWGSVMYLILLAAIGYVGTSGSLIHRRRRTMPPSARRATQQWGWVKVSIFIGFACIAAVLALMALVLLAELGPFIKWPILVIVCAAIFGVSFGAREVLLAHTFDLRASVESPQSDRSG